MDNDEAENVNSSGEEKNTENTTFGHHFNPFSNYDRTDLDSRLQRDRSCSRSRSRSPSHTPTRSQSSTPEASDSLDADEMEDSAQQKYERCTIYDFNAQIASQEEDAQVVASSSDFSSELPFKPIMNYKPATEIDGSITSHLPMTWKVLIVDLPRPSYLSLRKSSNKSMEQIIDPRLRRILGLPELRYTLPSPGSRGMRKLSNNIASPDSEEASPKYYIPPSSSPYYDDRKMTQTSKVTVTAKSNSSSKSTVTTSLTTTTTATTTTASASAVVEPRLTDPRARKDPRRAAAAAAVANTRTTTTEEKSNNSATTDGVNAASKQNIEIRNLLHKSEWYKNLNSKFKIMVNQQLALVSTELKKFHQNPSPQKIFDMSFILNNSTLQQILTQLGIYIDENGEVGHIDTDIEDKPQQEQISQKSGNEHQITLPNLSQPPPDFLRGPPPNLAAPPPNLNSSLPTLPPPQLFRPTLNLAPFGVLNATGRPSLLGLPPTSNAANNAFNHPFAAELANAVNLPAAAFAQGLLGPFNNFATGPQATGGLMLPNNMRNFGNNNSNGQRNNRNRRNKI